MKNTEKKQLELDYLNKRINVFLDFHIYKYGQSTFFTECKDVIEKAYLNRDLKALKFGSKDLNNWLREMPTKDALELGEILKRELGEDISLVEKKRIAHIQKIIKKGKIANLDEYELVQGRTDEIYADADKQEELSSLNNLLIKFDTPAQLSVPTKPAGRSL